MFANSETAKAEVWSPEKRYSGVFFLFLRLNLKTPYNSENFQTQTRVQYSLAVQEMWIDLPGGVSGFLHFILKFPETWYKSKQSLLGAMPAWGNKKPAQADCYKKKYNLSRSTIKTQRTQADCWTKKGKLRWISRHRMISNSNQHPSTVSWKTKRIPRRTHPLTISKLPTTTTPRTP